MNDAKNVETKFPCGGATLEGECKKQPCIYTFNCRAPIPAIPLSNSRLPSVPSVQGGRHPNLQIKNLKIATMTAKIGLDGTG